MLRSSVSSFLAVVCGLVASGTSPHLLAAPFTPGNLVVLRVNGTGAAARAVDLVEFDTVSTGQSGTVVVSLPSSGSGTLLTQAGNSTWQGALTLSANRTHLLLAGYNAPAGTANVSSTSSATVARVVATVEWTGNVNLTTLTTAYSGQHIHGAAALSGAPGSDVWLAGSGGPGGASMTNGIRYMTVGGSGPGTRVVNPTPLAANHPRVVQIVNNQLYFSDNNNIRRTNVPLPTTGDVPTTDLTTTGLIQARGFVFFDYDGNGILDTLYVADQTNGLVKFSSEDGDTWTQRGSLAGSFTGITGEYTGSSYVLYVTTGNGTTAGNQLRRYVDTAAYNQNIAAGSFVTLATAPAGTIFRGVVFAPIPESNSLALAACAVVLLGGLAIRGQLPGTGQRDASCNRPRA
jgi:hypothetical protein